MKNTITELLEKIKVAVFGKEVRDSIHDAIKVCYEDASKNGNANMEVAQARGKFETLNERLNYSDNSKAEDLEFKAEITLREKEDKNLQSQIDKLSNGSPLAANSINDMIDTSKIYVNTTDGHKYYFNGDTWIDFGVYQSTEIADNSVELHHTNFFTKGKKNLWNYDKIIKGAISESDGLERPNYTAYRTDYIPVIVNEKYIVSGGPTKGQRTFTFYDSEKKFIGIGDSWEKTIVPENAYYMILSVYYKDGKEDLKDVMLEKGDKVSKYRNFYTLDESFLDIDDLIDLIQNNRVDIDSLKNGIDSENVYNKLIISCNDFYANQPVDIAILTNITRKTMKWSKFNNNPGNILSKKIDLSKFDFKYLKLKFSYTSDFDFGFMNGSSWYKTFESTEEAKTISLDIPREIIEQKNLLKEYYLQFSSSDTGDVEFYDFELLLDGKLNILSEIIDDFEKKIDFLKDNMEIIDTENPLKNKIENGGLASIFPRIACIGDSLTKGGMEWVDGPTGVYDYSKFSYPSHMQRVLNNIVINMGSSGACASPNAHESFYADWNIRADTEKWLTEENKADAYIIALGTNDIGYAGSFDGELATDINDEDYNQNSGTSVGGYGKIIQRIKELQPRAKIFCVTIPNTRNSEITRKEANTKIRAIAEHFNCFIIDLEKYGVQPDNVSLWKSIYYNIGHLNCLGYKELSNMLLKYIDYIIKNNPNSFYDIPVIETDYK